ncbi:MAG: hypothetical protein ABSC42_17990 [Tepidisphaeraceae bacterium]
MKEFMAASIYSRQPQLKPSAMRTVADRRFDDAETLCETKQNARANGAAYLVGFVVEILLKARLVRKHPQIARKRQHEMNDLSSAEREIWFLIWKQHDLEGMLSKLEELEAALKKQGEREGENYLEDLKKICATWTIQARYSSHTMQHREAEELIERVRVLKEKLK